MNVNEELVIGKTCHLNLSDHTKVTLHKTISCKTERRGHNRSNKKVSKGAKIRNRYNQVPHLTQDTNGKVTNSQLDTTNESQEVSPFPAGDHKAHKNRRAHKGIANARQKKNIKDPQKKYRLGTVSKIFYWMA